MNLTPEQQGVKNIARYMLAIAIMDAKKGFHDYECPEQEPEHFLSSSWGETICDIAQLEPDYVRSLMPPDLRSPRPASPIRLIEVATASGRHRNVVASCHAAAQVARCTPVEIYRALRTGRTRLSSGWNVRYKEGTDG